MYQGTTFDPMTHGMILACKTGSKLHAYQ